MIDHDHQRIHSSNGVDREKRTNAITLVDVIALNCRWLDN